MLKYIEASLLTSAGGCITSIDASRSGTCSTMSAKNRHGYTQRTAEHTHRFGKVAPAESLPSQSASTHAQESEYPVNHIERHAAHGYCTNI